MIAIDGRAGFPSPPLAGPGKVIALEGIDGSGTTTHAGLLADRLEAEGVEVVRTCEPSRGPIGALVRRGLADPTPGGDGLLFDAPALALLFAADRLEHLERVVRPAVARGAFVVSDRSIVSSLVYQGSELDPAWIAALNARAPWPHRVLWLALDPQTCLGRVHRREARPERYERIDILRRLHERYARLAEEGGRTPVLRVDAGGSPEEVHERIWALIR